MCFTIWLVSFVNLTNMLWAVQGSLHLAPVLHVKSVCILLVQLYSPTLIAKCGVLTFEWRATCRQAFAICSVSYYLLWLCSAFQVSFCLIFGYHRIVQKLIFIQKPLLAWVLSYFWLCIFRWIQLMLPLIEEYLRADLLGEWLSRSDQIFPFITPCGRRACYLIVIEEVNGWFTQLNLPCVLRQSSAFNRQLRCKIVHLFWSGYKFG